MQRNISTDYAIRIIVHMARHKKIVSSTALANSTSISKRYLLQIAAKLRDAGGSCCMHQFYSTLQEMNSK